MKLTKIKRGTVREDGKLFNCYNGDKEVWITQEAWNKINANSQLTRWRNKLKVIHAYGGKCKHCDEVDPIVLTVDHVFNNGHKHTDSKGRRVTGNSLYSSIIKDNYPDTYQILCFNCNWRKEFHHRNSYYGE
jgi:hypothetical protein